MRTNSFLQISALHWADIIVGYALFVMQNYFTDVWKLSLTQAAKILNIWNGIYRILPLFLLYLGDTFLGNFKLLLFTSISYRAGIMLVFMSLPPILADSTHSCKGYEPRCVSRAEEGLLYADLALIAVGVAGNLVSIEPLLLEQRETNTLEHAYAHQYVGLIAAVIVGVFGKTIPFIRPWTLRFGIPAVCTILATLWFLSGWRSYKREPRNPNGSILFTVRRVLVAAALKNFLPYPSTYRGYHGIEECRFSRTSYLRALHKAAIIAPNYDGFHNRWKLCSVREVEETKIIFRMMPLWMTFIVCGVISSTGDTYFVEQAGKLRRRIGKFKPPVEILLLARKWLSYFFNSYIVQNYKFEFIGAWWGRVNVTFLEMTFGLVCSVLCCISAAGTERMRLHVVRKHGLLDKPDEDIPMSMFWLIFQFVLIGSFDSILEKGVNAYYREQCPMNMKAAAEAITQAMFGLGFMSSSVSVYVVGRISEMGGRRNWFQETLNRSRLDCYYWVLAAWSSVNLVVFIVVVSCFRFKSVEEEWAEDIDLDGYVDGHNPGPEFGRRCFLLKSLYSLCLA